MKRRSITLLITGLLAAQVSANDPQTLNSEQDKFSYTVGQNIGYSLKRQGTQLDVDALAKGLTDAYSGNKPLLSFEEMTQILRTYQQKQAEQQAEEQKQLKQQADKNLKEGEAFLAKNAKKEGVVTLQSGLQYKVITEGTGKSPSATDKVTTHYRGTLIDGTEFDSSYKRGSPLQFGVNQVIAGWQEALQLMKEGAKWQLVIPAKLAYKEAGAPGGKIGPNATLIFDIELISVDN
jgi:FKBP-type peptidyl-prolyl cis-trans isomerase